MLGPGQLTRWLGSPPPEHPEAGEAMNPLQLTCGLTTPDTKLTYGPCSAQNLHMDFPGV